MFNAVQTIVAAEHVQDEDVNEERSDDNESSDETRQAPQTKKQKSKIFNFTRKMILGMKLDENGLMCFDWT